MNEYTHDLIDTDTASGSDAQSDAVSEKKKRKKYDDKEGYLSKEDFLKKSDEEILEFMKGSQGHTGDDFRDYMKCNFSYSLITSTLRDRGYEPGWFKVGEGNLAKPTTIKMKKTNAEITRQSFMIEKEIADEWKEFNRNVPFKTVTLGSALRRFMDDVRKGKIKFELEI